MFLYYSILKCVVELSRDTVDLQRPIFWEFFFSMSNQALLVTTFVKYRSKRELFTQTYFRPKFELSKSIFRGKTSCFLEFTRVYVS